GLGPRLAADASEGGADAVIVVLRPAFERVVMAFGALNANAEEELRRSLGGVLRVLAGAPVIGSGVFVGAAAGREQLAGEFIERLVVADRLIQPEPELLHSRGVELLGVRAEHVAGDQSPVGSKVVRIDERIDQPIALVGALIGQKGLRFLNVRESARSVEI